MNLNDLASKKVAVLGIGVEGIAVAEYLLSKGASIDVLDKKDQDELYGSSLGREIMTLFKNEKCRTVLGDNYLNNLNKYDIVFRSPGIKYLTPEIQEAKLNGTEISSQIKLFFDLCPAKIIGVTGTKGKGTTSTLIYEILKNKYKVFLAGNIGLPAITLLNQIDNNDYVVLELSSFQLQDLHKSPHIAVITNLTQDHLDYHSGLDEYKNAKKSIFAHQEKNDYLIVNNSVEKSYYSEAKSQIKIVSSSSNIGIAAGVELFDQYSGEAFLTKNDYKLKICNSGELSLVGIHNLENIAAASLTADILGVGIDAIRKSVVKFKGLPHRLEYIGDIEGIKIYNDSFATNPAPTIAAIDSFSQDKVLILGGSSKNADFKPLCEKIIKNNVIKIILIGNEASRLNEALIQESYRGEIFLAGNDLKFAIKKAIENCNEQSVLLFSPACASFDMFKDYKDRGEQFKKLVWDMQNNG